jgi:hypothetical protein
MLKSGSAVSHSLNGTVCLQEGLSLCASMSWLHHPQGSIGLNDPSRG